MVLLDFAGDVRLSVGVRHEGAQGAAVELGGALAQNAAEREHDGSEH